MGLITSEIVDILKFLLPGFLSLFIIYWFTSYPKKSEFEAVVIALILTLAIRPLFLGVKYLLFCIGKKHSIATWKDDFEIIILIPISFILGALISLLINHDLFHRLMRKLKITNQTSYPSEWYGVFSENKNFVVLHLNDGRRIFGWPEEWPDYPDKGHFIIKQAEWLLENNKSIELPPENKTVIKGSLVDFVEIVIPEGPEKKEKGNVSKGIRATKSK